MNEELRKKLRIRLEAQSGASAYVFVGSGSRPYVRGEVSLYGEEMTLSRLWPGELTAELCVEIEAWFKEKWDALRDA